MAAVLCCCHDGRFMLADGNGVLRKGDEVVVLTHDRNLETLRNRWTGTPGE